MKEKTFWLTLAIVSSIGIGAITVLLVIQTISVFGGQK